MSHSRKKLIFISRSPQDTIDLGAMIGSWLQPEDVVILAGGLGSGKTQLTRGLAYGLGVAEDSYITSPSFALINEYQGRIPLYHFDLYRLEDEEQMEELGYEEYFFGQGVCVVEWGDKFPGILPSEHLTIELKSINEDVRELRIFGTGNRFYELIEKLKRQ